MTVTIEVINTKTLSLLNDLESMGLIHVLPSVPQNTEKPAQEGKRTFGQIRGIHAVKEEGPPPYQWLRGCCKSERGDSVERFLADCREDKEHEFSIERRQEEERTRLTSANAKVSS